MDHISPFQQIHNGLNANCKVYHGWQLPADYGDIDTETDRLYDNCAVFDLCSFGRIEISGKRAFELLDYLAAGDIKKITQNQTCQALICNEKANIAEVIRIIPLKNSSYMILTSPPKREVVLKLAQSALKVLSLGDVSVADKTLETAMIGLYGPQSFKLAKEILPINLTELETEPVKQISIFMLTATIIRGGWVGGTDSIEIITSAKAAMLAGMAISKYEKKGLVQPAGMDCLNRALTQASLPLSADGRTEAEKYNPYNLGLGDKIDMSKNFLGKETLLAEKDSLGSKTVVGLKIKGLKTRHQNLSLQYDNAQIGWVDTVDYSKKLDSGVGLAIIDSQYANLKEEVQITGDGVILGAEITALPIINELAADIYR